LLYWKRHRLNKSDYHILLIIRSLLDILRVRKSLGIKLTFTEGQTLVKTINKL
jgi:hypothetical protein